MEIVKNDEDSQHLTLATLAWPQISNSEIFILNGRIQMFLTPFTALFNFSIIPK